jgi:phage terminase large subunit-like protein
MGRRSPASFFLSLPLETRKQRLATLTPTELEQLRFLWSFWARPEQHLPAGDWQTWLVLAGRGFGKTRTGAEAVREWAKHFRYVNLIGATLDDARDIMIEGESGILACCPRDERPKYVGRQLHWPSGCKSLIFTADEPERLRGKQHEKVWADELAAWRYAEAWDQAMLGLRLGSNPQAVVTTTPRPTPIIRELLKDAGTIVTSGSTYENRVNLAPKFFDKVIRKYEGTRLGRQELNAEVLTDNPRALWNRGTIDRDRVEVAPELQRIVVGLDPNVKNRDLAQLAKSSATLDEAGIVAAGTGPAPAGWKPPNPNIPLDVSHFYIIGDRSVDAGPNEWGNAAVKAYKDFAADRIIGEVNNGGDMVEMTIRNVDRDVSYKSVTASRGKAIRAEPISSLYEQGRVHHVGSLAQLEDEMCDFDPVTTVKSPNRMDALVWALTELSDETGLGLFEYFKAAAAHKGHVPAVGTSVETRQGFGT